MLCPCDASDSTRHVCQFPYTVVSMEGIYYEWIYRAFIRVLQRPQTDLDGVGVILQYLKYFDHSQVLSNIHQAGPR